MSIKIFDQDTVTGVVKDANIADNLIASYPKNSIVLLPVTGSTTDCVIEFIGYGVKMSERLYIGACSGVLNESGTSYGSNYSDVQTALKAFLGTTASGGGGVSADVTIVEDEVGLATETGQGALLTELEKKADLTETQPVNVASNDTDFATSAKQDEFIANTSNGNTPTNTVINNTTTSTTFSTAKSRVKIVIWNTSDVNLYIKEGSGASSSSFTYKLDQDEAVIIDDSDSIITGVWESSSTGEAQITEVTIV